MRVIDKDAPTDLETFWFALGEMRVMAAAIKGQQSDEVVIEVDAGVAEALNAADAAEAGRAAFLRGVSRKLDEAIAARAPWIKAALAAYVESVPAGAVTVRPEKRMLKRRTVEAFDADGRILSMLEEEIKV
jgi:hypothetical protein